MTNTHEHTPMKDLFASKPARIAAIALGVIAVLLLACNIFTPNPIWGPQILKDSPVDVSVLEPLAELAKYSPEELRLYVSMLDEMGKFHRTRESDFTRFGNDGVDGLLWSFGYDLKDSYQGGAVFDIYDTVENAERALQWGRERGPFLSGIQSSDVIISDDLEAALWPVFWERSHYPPFFYRDSAKYLSTRIRVGSMIISLGELSGNLDTMGQPTNQTLQQIVDSFKAAELQGTDD